MNKDTKNTDRRLTLNKVTVLKLTDLKQVTGGGFISFLKVEARRA